MDLLVHGLDPGEVPPQAPHSRSWSSGCTRRWVRHMGGRLTDDVALMVLRNDRTRVAAQSAEPGLRRSRREPSNR
ncbi:hypothetical protein [Streptomyces sp. NBC_00259]|uniref:hypothetical protein n=1 Tax=Streptomyces sp. NBC_00259 TaxID=2903643 RepID=UPI002E27E32A|nr:hypothetical protein [Streptomyces sp. NBC_00259]